MNERTANLTNVQKTLPALRQINDLYNRGRSMRKERENKLLKHDFDASETRFLVYIYLAGAVFVASWFLMAGILKVFPWLPGFVIIPTMIGLPIAAVLWYRKNAKEDTRIKGMRLSNEYMAKIEAISREIQTVAQKNTDIFTLLPRDYRYYDAAVFFEQAFANGRADTMKEAINLYETHLHQQSMERLGAQILKENRRQSAMLASIEANTYRTANAAESAANAAVIGFLTRD